MKLATIFWLGLLSFILKNHQSSGKRREEDGGFDNFSFDIGDSDIEDFTDYEDDVTSVKFENLGFRALLGGNVDYGGQGKNFNALPHHKESRNSAVYYESWSSPNKAQMFQEVPRDPVTGGQALTPTATNGNDNNYFYGTKQGIGLDVRGPYNGGPTVNLAYRDWSQDDFQERDSPRFKIPLGPDSGILEDGSPVKSAPHITERNGTTDDSRVKAQSLKKNQSLSNNEIPSSGMNEYFSSPGGEDFEDKVLPTSLRNSYPLDHEEYGARRFWPQNEFYPPLFPSYPPRLNFPPIIARPPSISYPSPPRPIGSYPRQPSAAQTPLQKSLNTYSIDQENFGKQFKEDRVRAAYGIGSLPLSLHNSQFGSKVDPSKDLQDLMALNNTGPMEWTPPGNENDTKIDKDSRLDLSKVPVSYDSQTQYGGSDILNSTATMRSVDLVSSEKFIQQPTTNEQKPKPEDSIKLVRNDLQGSSIEDNVSDNTNSTIQMIPADRILSSLDGAIFQPSVLPIPGKIGKDSELEPNKPKTSNFPDTSFPSKRAAARNLDFQDGQYFPPPNTQMNQRLPLHTDFTTLQYSYPSNPGGYPATPYIWSQNGQYSIPTQMGGGGPPYPASANFPQKQLYDGLPNGSPNAIVPQDSRVIQEITEGRAQLQPGQSPESRPYFGDNYIRESNILGPYPMNQNTNQAYLIPDSSGTASRPQSTVDTPWATRPFPINMALQDNGGQTTGNVINGPSNPNILGPVPAPTSTGNISPTNPASINSPQQTTQVLNPTLQIKEIPSSKDESQSSQDTGQSQGFQEVPSFLPAPHMWDPYAVHPIRYLDASSISQLVNFPNKPNDTQETFSVSAGAENNNENADTGTQESEINDIDIWKRSGEISEDEAFVPGPNIWDPYPVNPEINYVDPVQITKLYSEMEKRPDQMTRDQLNQISQHDGGESSKTRNDLSPTEMEDNIATQENKDSSQKEVLSQDGKGSTTNNHTELERLRHPDERLIPDWARNHSWSKPISISPELISKWIRPFYTPISYVKH